MEGNMQNGWPQTRLLAGGIGMALLALHFYFFLHATLMRWHLDWGFADRFLKGLAPDGLVGNFTASRNWILFLFLVASAGSKPKGFARPLGHAILLLLLGLAVYYASSLVLVSGLSPSCCAAGYFSGCIAGLAACLWGGSGIISRLHSGNFQEVFNRSHESFPQQEDRIENLYSVNLPSRYRFRGTMRKSWVNITNPFRGLLVVGTPGSGKSYFIVREVIRQHIRKGFSMLIYDFKYDDLTRIAYREFLLHRDRFAVPPAFHIVQFDDLARSSRCNPLDPASMRDVTDAAEAARTILLGLNQQWIRRQGDFFVESPIHFVTALIWFLRSYQEGKFCTLPHVVEFSRVPYDKLFTLLRTDPVTEALVHPFVTAYLHHAMEQLEGQIASATISLSRLASPPLYYLLTGNDCSLDIANPLEPKILCIGNNSQKSSTYGPVAALYLTAVTRTLNTRGNLKSSLVFDEFPTIYLHGIDRLMATARSNRVATTLAVQDLSQLRLYYGRELAEVILNITGNIISGQVSGETGRHLSERFGRILQERQTVSTHDSSNSVTHSSHLEQAIPMSRIATMSTGEFVGTVSDELDRPQEQKVFYCRVDPPGKNKDRQEPVAEIPNRREPVPGLIQEHFLAIRKDITDLVEKEMERILDTPTLASLIVKP